jgi:hypothetical protein
MTHHSATPDPLDDDAIADALADEMLDRASATFPGADPEFLIRIASLYLSQATGSVNRPTHEQLAGVFGTSREYIGQVERNALAKLYRDHRDTLLSFFHAV